MFLLHIFFSFLFVTYWRLCGWTKHIRNLLRVSPQLAHNHLFSSHLPREHPSPFFCDKGQTISTLNTQPAHLARTKQPLHWRSALYLLRKRNRRMYDSSFQYSQKYRSHAQILAAALNTFAHIFTGHSIRWVFLSLIVCVTEHEGSFENIYYSQDGCIGLTSLQTENRA